VRRNKKGRARAYSERSMNALKEHIHCA